jgi:hypothetical protein
MSIRIEPIPGFVMAYCENKHSKVGLSIEMTPDEARLLARDLINFSDIADRRPIGGKIGRSHGSWYPSAPTPADDTAREGK